MTKITAIASYVPEIHEDNYEKALQFSVHPEFIDKKIGARFLAKASSAEQASDLAQKAVSSLLKLTSLSLDKIDALIVCTQNPDGFGLPHTSAIVHGKLELPLDCACFDISLGCSGYVYGLSIASGYMSFCGFQNVIFVNNWNPTNAVFLHALFSIHNNGI